MIARARRCRVSIPAAYVRDCVPPAFGFEDLIHMGVKEEVIVS